MSIGTKKPLDIYILAGITNTGKSCTVRNITNRPRQCVMDITINLKIYCKVQSLQEAKKSPKDFIELVRKKYLPKNISAVLVPLRTDITRNMPEADFYIDEFKKCGWNIKYVAELGGGTKLQKYCKEKQYGYKSFARENSIDDLFPKARKFFGFKG